MTSKEAQKIILSHIDDLDLIFDEELQKALNKIAKDLEILEIFKKYCFIKISDTSTLDKFYYILLKDKYADDYMGFYVKKQEKDLLKEYFDDTPRT